MYYYRAERRNGKVVKEYVGGGEAAGLIADHDGFLREIREGRELETRLARGPAEALEASVAELDRFVTEATAKALEAAGYHRHDRGAWRKRRGKGGAIDGC